MLSVSGLVSGYGARPVLDDISLQVLSGEIVCLIGSNGAGKTTLLRSISGTLRPWSGSVAFCGEELAGNGAHAIVRRGLVQVPEGRKVFPEMTVRENLELGAFTRNDAAIDDDLARVFELFPVLRERHRQLAGSLSGGQQQMLAFGRALMSRPRLLLLDEPSMGLAPLIVQHLFEAVVSVHSAGTPVLLVEQNATLALEVADRGYVLESGRIILSGPARELADNDLVKRAYLGL